ncbi:MAG: hypothetical protein HQL56_02700 [Magnetococcales bacterium]|nr:hypothetical protein [Magnetococcales bacterium]
MDSIEVASIKPGQELTLTFGNRDAVLTKLEASRHFKVDSWFPEEQEIYILDDVIQEDELLHYAFEPIENYAALLQEESKSFGVKRRIQDFLGRTLDTLEMEEEEEEEDEESEE